jgi:hypothetical protein
MSSVNRSSYGWEGATQAWRHVPFAFVPFGTRHVELKRVGTKENFEKSVYVKDVQKRGRHVMGVHALVGMIEVMYRKPGSEGRHVEKGHSVILM